MGRQLDTVTLEQAAVDMAGAFLQPSQFSRSTPDQATWGREWVLQTFHNALYKDEFDYLLPAFKDCLGPRMLAEFEALAKERFTPRGEPLLHQLLADNLAIDPDGEHIPGKIGKIKLDGRRVGYRLKVKDVGGVRMELVKPEYWPIYAGEAEERAADSGVADPIPEDGLRDVEMAFNTRISNEVAQLMANAGIDNLDEGTLGAVIQGRTGAQPADPDTAVTGTNLFTLTCSATAFGAATDAAPGALKTANAITDDSSADATGTLGYCRASSSSVTDTPLDDHIDGEAGTSGADFNFNTLAIVAAAVVSMTSWTVTMPES